MSTEAYTDRPMLLKGDAGFTSEQANTTIMKSKGTTWLDFSGVAKKEMKAEGSLAQALFLQSQFSLKRFIYTKESTRMTNKPTVTEHNMGAHILAQITVMRL